jgi:hypothetical protein
MISNILTGAAAMSALLTVGLASRGWWLAALSPAVGSILAVLILRWWERVEGRR